MARHADSWGNALMSEKSAEPARRSMATVTGHRCRNVRHGFSLFDAVVVALGAATRSDSVMSEESRHPTGGAMTGVTVHRRR
jgi:predicted nucleic acid-binding protein